MSDQDRIKRGLQRYVDSRVAHADYFAFYAGTVIAQATDNTLEVRLDKPDMPSVVGVQLRHGLPNCVVRVNKGARVMVGFDGGDPSKPYCALWEHGQSAANTIAFKAAGDMIFGISPHATDADKGVFQVSTTWGSRIVFDSKANSIQLVIVKSDGTTKAALVIDEDGVRLAAGGNIAAQWKTDGTFSSVGTGSCNLAHPGGCLGSASSPVGFIGVAALTGTAAVGGISWKVSS